jgi:ribosomal protein L19E
MIIPIKTHGIINEEREADRNKERRKGKGSKEGRKEGKKSGRCGCRHQNVAETAPMGSMTLNVAYSK